MQHPCKKKQVCDKYIYCVKHKMIENNVQNLMVSAKSGYMKFKKQY